jgi:hypothetical protein
MKLTITRQVAKQEKECSPQLREDQGSETIGDHLAIYTYANASAHANAPAHACATPICMNKNKQA